MPKKTSPTNGPTRDKAERRTSATRQRTAAPGLNEATGTRSPSSARGSRTASRTSPAKDRPSTVREQVAESASTVKREVRQTASGLAQRARTSVERLADEQRQRACRRLTSTASSLREVAERFDDPLLERTTGAAAERLYGFAEHLDSNDLQTLVGEAEDVARRRPAVFLGSMFVAGVLLGRFLRSSPESARDRADGASNGEGSLSAPGVVVHGPQTGASPHVTRSGDGLA